MSMKDVEKKTKWVYDSLGLEFNNKLVDDGLEIL